MSTRGWYKYYVVEEKTKKIFLAMQFYKWGDATPEGALAELQGFERDLKKLKNRLPLVFLDEMLKENLGKGYARLPRYFSGSTQICVGKFSYI